MMIQRFAAAALVAAVGASAHAVELNKDALKAMQQQGHEIVAEGARSFKAQGNLCLDTATNALVVKACSDEAASQQWQFDDQRHLVAHSGQCVAGARLADCGAESAHTWTHDETQRLANEAGQCLQVQGSTPTAGASVVTAPCSDAAGQVWE